MASPIPDYRPPVGFYFTVTIAGFDGAGDSSFSEVSGLDAERPVLDIKEGGENRFTHRVPERAKYANLMLKRGVLLSGSGLSLWCKDALESDLAMSIVPKDLNVMLLDQDGTVLLTWSFSNAWPVKWSVSALSAEKNEIAVETLELAYSYFTKS